MENHHHHSGRKMPPENKIQVANRNDINNTDRSKMDHRKMDHSSMHHNANPSMGMEGHDHHAMMIMDFKKRFFVTLILSVPILLLSPMIQHWLGIDWKFAGSGYVLFSLSTFVYLFGGWPFLKGWYQEMRFWNPGMMTLIGFAISVAYIY